MRLLWYGETPFIQTGAGQVAKQLLSVFLELFDSVHLVAIDQWWIEPELPERLSITIGSIQDQWNVQAIKAAIVSHDEYDCLFLTTDLNLIADLREAIEIARQAGKRIIMYAAMDTNFYVPSFFKILELATIPVLYSYWCQTLVKKMLPELHTEVVYHGSEPDIFYPLPAEARHQARQDIFGVEDDTFIVLNVNRNQVRKDLTRSMAAFHLFHLEYPDSMLYLHAKRQDLGGNLINQARALGLRTDGPRPEIVFSPESYHEAEGISRADLNRIYNAANVFMTTTTGEGWGLTTTEAMAAETPVIGPWNTTFPEQLGAVTTQWTHYACTERGILVESGGPDLWVTFYGITDMPRELTSVTGMSWALRNVYHYRDEARERAKSARIWTQEHIWSNVQEQWKQLLSKVVSHAAK